MKKKCLECKHEFQGRVDKKFCSVKCKNDYNYRLRKTTKSVTKQIDAILHRNREILEQVMASQKTQKLMLTKLELERWGFNFNYITGFYKNNQGKLYHYVYDYAWMEFSKQEVMIVRKKIK